MPYNKTKTSGTHFSSPGAQSRSAPTPCFGGSAQVKTAKMGTDVGSGSRRALQPGTEIFSRPPCFHMQKGWPWRSRKVFPMSNSSIPYGLPNKLKLELFNFPWDIPLHFPPHGPVRLGPPVALITLQPRTRSSGHFRQLLGGGEASF